MENTVYDYDNQVWVTGDAAKPLLIAQMEQELTILRSPRGQEYLDFSRRKSEPRRFVADVVASYEARLAQVRG